MVADGGGLGSGPSRAAPFVEGAHGYAARGGSVPESYGFGAGASGRHLESDGRSPPDLLAPDEDESHGAPGPTGGGSGEVSAGDRRSQCRLGET